MAILAWILFGLVVGVVAKFIMPGKDPSGCIITIVLGIVGSAVGGLIGTQLGWGGVNEFDLKSFGLAVLGALVCLAIYRAVIGRKQA